MTKLYFSFYKTKINSPRPSPGNLRYMETETTLTGIMAAV